MYQPRYIAGQRDWLDVDGIKIYTISVDDQSVALQPFVERLTVVKTQLAVNWAETAAFVIFHRGASCNYLVLVWWGNDNELFTSVSVQQSAGWVIDASRYSFCLYDMEIMWRERNLYIQTMDCVRPSLTLYRTAR